MYNLNSRYYEAEIGRVISADTIDLVLASKTTLTDKNLYAYCDNNPVVFADDTGTIAESIFDIVSFCGSMVQVAANPADPWAWASLAGDAVDMIPIVTGCGEAIKAMKLASESSDVLKTAGKVLKKWEVGDPIDALTQAGKAPTWQTVKKRFWKNMCKALEGNADIDAATLARLRRGLAPLDDDNIPLQLHHPKWRDTPYNYYTFGPTTAADHRNWHKKYGYRK